MVGVPFAMMSLEKFEVLLRCILSRGAQMKVRVPESLDLKGSRLRSFYSLSEPH
jgi:hypothetical protein